MKKIIFPIAIFCISIGSLSARSSATPQEATCRTIAQSLWFDYQSKGKELPTTFEDMSVLREMIEQNPRTVELVNNMAIIPGAPVIQPEQGISRDFHGRRLFAIGRTTNLDYAIHKTKNGPLESGRYSIVIALDGKGGTTDWIPEIEVQTILRQIKDFDPAKQPLVFENVAQLAHDKKTQQDDQMNQAIRKNVRIWEKFGLDVQTTSGGPYSSRWGRCGSAWLAGGISLVAFLIWIILRKRARR